jgi:hypothetical protein
MSVTQKVKVQALLDLECQSHIFVSILHPRMPLFKAYFYLSHENLNKYLQGCKI